ncbi:MAG: hypothetical protein U0269_10235 [Polyangiales bacterium]
MNATRLMVCAAAAVLTATCAARQTPAPERPVRAASASTTAPQRMSVDDVIAFVRAIRPDDPERPAHLQRAMQWAFAAADEERARIAPLDPATVPWEPEAEASDAPVHESARRERDPRAMRELEERTRAGLLRFDRATIAGLRIAQQRLFVEERSDEAANVLVEMGVRQTQLGLESGATLTRFVRIFPGHPRVAEAYFNLGIASLARLRLDAARPIFERTLELGGAGHRAAVLMYLARIALIQARLDDALGLARLALQEPTAREVEQDVWRIMGAALAESASADPRWIERVESCAQAARLPSALTVMLESMLYARVTDEPRQRAIIALFEQVLARDRATFCAVREVEREDQPLVPRVIERVRALRISARCEP